MGKVKPVIMGDEIAEEEARKKAAAKRASKKAEKEATKHKEDTNDSPTIAEVEKVTEETNKDSKKKRVESKKEDKYHFGRGKTYLEMKKKVQKNKLYSLTEAVKLVKETSFSKFDGSIELHVNVVEKGIRGTVALPHSTGKDVRVKIADEKLIEELTKSGKVDFDILVASPDMMPKLAKVAKVLGPKGLMPNPKTGTISPNPEKLAKELASGQLQWKTEAQTPIVHATLAKVSFESKDIEDNLSAVIKAIGKDRIRSAFIKATMGPAIRVSL